MTDTRTTSSSSQLGVLDINLITSRSGPDCATQTELRSVAPGVARSIPIIIGALLFTQRQIRTNSDPTRLETVAKLQASVAAARDGSLTAPRAPGNGRAAAIYQIVVSANGAFRIELEQKLDGVLSDAAGSLTTRALADELLTTLPEPYRSFFAEMLQAAIPVWRERRPPLGESTWNWPIALRRLDTLVRGETTSDLEGVICPDCRSIRPINSPCLRCGSTAQPTAPPVEVTSLIAASDGPNQEPPRSAASLLGGAPVTSPLNPITIAEPTAPAPPVEPAVATFSPSIVPAQDLAPDQVIREPETYLSWPLASFGRRLGAALVDTAVAVVLGVVGAFGATMIGLASGGIAGDQAGQSFFPSAALLIAGLYFILGWSSNETAGMLLFRLRLIRQINRKPGGIFRAFFRAVGYLLTIVIGIAIFAVGLFIDSRLPFVVGTLETVYQIIVGVISLYAIWSLTGQRILTGRDRQTLGDQFARSVVTLKT